MSPGHDVRVLDSANGKVSVDLRRWPVVIVTQLAQQLTDKERTDSMAETDAILETRPGPYSLVLDNRLAGPLPPKQREIVARYMTRNATRDRERCMSGAFVVSSALLQGVLTAICWLRRPVTETQVFRTLDEAVAWTSVRHHENCASRAAIQRG